MASPSGGDAGEGDGEIGRLLEVRQAEWLDVALRALGPLRPLQMRRFERVKELVQVLSRTSIQHAQWFAAAQSAEGSGGGEITEWDTASEALESFQPEHGASGRPRPLGEYAPGTMTAYGARKLLGNPGRPVGAWARLDDTVFEIGNSQTTKVYRFPSASSGARTRGRRAPKEVAELVWFEALVPLSAQSTRGFRERALLLLDARGYCLAIVENIPFSPEEVFQLARAASVPAAAYRVRCLDGQAEEIQDLMFPRRARVKKM